MIQHASQFVHSNSLNDAHPPLASARPNTVSLVIGKLSKRDIIRATPSLPLSLSLHLSLFLSPSISPSLSLHLSRIRPPRLCHSAPDFGNEFRFLPYANSVAGKSRLIVTGCRYPGLPSRAARTTTGCLTDSARSRATGLFVLQCPIDPATGEGGGREPGGSKCHCAIIIFKYLDDILSARAAGEVKGYWVDGVYPKFVSGPRRVGSSHLRLLRPQLALFIDGRPSDNERGPSWRRTAARGDLTGKRL